MFPPIFHGMFLDYLCMIDNLSNYEFKICFSPKCRHIHTYAHMHLEIQNEYVSHFCFDPLINIIYKMVNNNSNIHIYKTFSLFSTGQFCRSITYMVVEQNKKNVIVCTAWLYDVLFKHRKLSSLQDSGGYWELVVPMGLIGSVSSYYRPSLMQCLLSQQRNGRAISPGYMTIKLFFMVFRGFKVSTPG